MAEKPKRMLREIGSGKPLFDPTQLPFEPKGFKPRFPIELKPLKPKVDKLDALYAALAAQRRKFPMEKVADRSAGRILDALRRAKASGKK